MEKASKLILGIFILMVVVLGLMYYINETEVDPSRVYEVDLGPNPPRGNAQSSIVLVEFSDFQCPFCKKSLPVIERLLDSYDVSFYYRNFPLPMHENSFIAAQAAQCANDQGKFWEYHDVLFENQNFLSKPLLGQYAEEIGLDVEEFDSCLNSGKYTDFVEQEIKIGESLKITGTPTFFVNGKKVVGVDESLLRKYIEEELAK